MNINTHIDTIDNEHYRSFIFYNGTTTVSLSYELCEGKVCFDKYYTIEQLITKIQNRDIIKFDGNNNITFTDTDAVINLTCGGGYINYDVKVEFELNEFTEKFIKHLNELV